MDSMKLFNQKMAQLLFLFFQLIFSAPDKLLGLIKTFTRYAILSGLFVSAAVAQTSSGLPPRILELVPKDAKLMSQNFTASPTMAVAQFSAEKSVGEDRSVNFSLVIRAFDNSSPTWKMRESAYRKQMEAHIQDHRASLAPESANQGMWTADPVKETKNAWGSAMTQRLLNHPPNASQYVNYNCAYFGMVSGIVFELFVSGVPESPDEADKWAQSVVQLASKLTVSNISE
jgi:hypothetical protein